MKIRKLLRNVLAAYFTFDDHTRSFLMNIFLADCETSYNADVTQRDV